MVHDIGNAGLTFRQWEPSEKEKEVLITLDGDLDKKLVGYGYIIKNLDAESQALETEIKRLTAKKKAKERHIAILKERMQLAMMENGKDVIDDPIMPVQLIFNPPSVRLDIDPKHLPIEYQRIKVEADRTALSKALKAGAETNGVVLEQKQHIRIGWWKFLSK